MIVVLSAIGLVLYSIASQADLIRITPLGVAVDEQTVTEPVPIGEDGFRTSFWGGGPVTLLDPLLLILATPTPGAAAPVIAYSTSDPDFTTGITLGGTNVYGGSWDTSTGFAGTYDESSSKDNTGGQITVYEYIGLTPDGDNSQNYPNWSGAAGLTSWDLWIYQVVFTPDFSRGDWVEFAATGLPGGSYVVGYGCTGIDGSNCTNEGKTQSTPFTFAGLVTVPEPGSIMLMGAGLIGLGLFRRKRKHT